jgi:hypothetical protein
VARLALREDRSGVSAGTGARASDPHAAPAAAWEPPGTLLGREYCSEEVFALERRRIFHSGWFCVGRAEEAPTPGSFLVADLAGESVLLVRGQDGGSPPAGSACPWIPSRRRRG